MEDSTSSPRGKEGRTAIAIVMPVVISIGLLLNVLLLYLVKTTETTEYGYYRSSLACTAICDLVASCITLALILMPGCVLSVFECPSWQRLSIAAVWGFCIIAAFNVNLYSAVERYYHIKRNRYLFFGPMPITLMVILTVIEAVLGLFPLLLEYLTSRIVLIFFWSVFYTLIASSIVAIAIYSRRTQLEVPRATDDEMLQLILKRTWQINFLQAANTVLLTVLPVLIFCLLFLVSSESLEKAISEHVAIIGVSVI